MLWLSVFLDASGQSPKPLRVTGRIKTVEIQSEKTTAPVKGKGYRLTPIRIGAILVFQNVTKSSLIVPTGGIVISYDRIARDLQALRATGYSHHGREFFKGESFAGKYPDAPDAAFAVLKPGESVEIPVEVATLELNRPEPGDYFLQVIAEDRWIESEKELRDLRSRWMKYGKVWGYATVESCPIPFTIPN